MNRILTFIFLTIVSLGLNANASPAVDLDSLIDKEEKLLAVDDAFIPTVEVLDDQVIVKFEIAKGYYLYKMRLGLTSSDANFGDLLIPEGYEKDDPYFGLTEVYYKFLEFSAPIESALNSSIMVKLDFQGCAEDRLCYPPTSREFELTISDEAAKNLVKLDAKSFKPADNSKTQSGFQNQTAVWVEEIKSNSLWQNFLWFIGAGLLMAFTACVYPMIPIISSIIVGQGTKQGEQLSTRKSFLLSLSYTQAVAITYAIMGVVVALIGKNFTAELQSPAFVITAAIIFVLLALSMFGLYEIKLPSALQEKLTKTSNKQASGSYLGAGIMGAISALIVSPCVTAPLIAAFIVISATGDAVLGAVTLYGLGFGIGIPLLVIGASGGKLLPKAGPWMSKIRTFFGLVMLGLALYIVKHLIPHWFYLGGLSVLAFVAAYVLGAFDTAATKGEKVAKLIGLLMALYAVSLAIGTYTGKGRIGSPLNGILAQSEHLQFKRIKSLDDLNRELAAAKAQNKTIMLDFFAEWCSACYEFEDQVFTDKKVQAALGNTVLLQADVTANDAQDVALMMQYQVLGLPTIMFFDVNGNELTNFRATGFEEAQQFLKRINAALNP
ncbi:MAG: protein-disulfide reductase DsbD [Gammaproteobacteria bacterium]|nr:protein-disulfide reductase DsbD [Gammaproteobacteria bacterium]